MSAFSIFMSAYSLQPLSFGHVLILDRLRTFEISKSPYLIAKKRISDCAYSPKFVNLAIEGERMIKQNIISSASTPMVKIILYPIYKFVNPFCQKK